MTEYKYDYVDQISVFAAMGSFLFGYQTGIISGTMMMDCFAADMNIKITDRNNLRQINAYKGATYAIMFIFLTGFSLGTLIIGPTCDRFCRKYSISVFGFIFMIGTILQTISFGLRQFMFGSFLTGQYMICSFNSKTRTSIFYCVGLSLGALSMILPVYHCEIARKELHEQATMLQQSIVIAGIATSFWLHASKFS